MAGIYDSDKTSALKIAELGDTIFVAESEKTPFARLLPRGKKPVQMLCSWPVQAYPRRGFGGTVDGTDISSFNSVNRDTIEAYGMWMMTEGWMVSKLANLTAAAGVPVGKEKAHQARMDALVLAQMIERQLLSDSDTVLESRPGTAYVSRGAFSWLQSGAQTTKPVPASYRPSSSCVYSGALASLTATQFENMLEAAANAKRAPVNLTGYVGISLKRQMTDWAVHDTEASATDKALRSYTISASEKKLIRTVDMFEFDSGSVVTFPSWYALCDSSTGENTAYTSKSGIFVDLDMWELCFMEEPASYEEPQKSGGPRGYNSAVYILKCLNPLGQMMVKTNS